MFTGLIQDLGVVRELARGGDGQRLRIGTPLAAGLRPGDSVAVNGVCLTVVSVVGDEFQAEVMNLTMTRSSLGALAPGARVNLETSLRAGDPMGGHLVQGHVDGVGTVAQTTEDGMARRVRIDTAGEILRYIVATGSIAVDGVSLTVAELDGGSFTVSLIPETLARTNLGAAGPGTTVNLEVDVLAKYVEKALANRTVGPV